MTDSPPPRLALLLEQFDHAAGRLSDRLRGPLVDSGNGTGVPVGALTDEEYRWEPVPGSWSVRRRGDGPGARATKLDGAASGAWGRDAAPFPHPVPPPFTTLSWRLSHLSELLFLRADHTNGSRSLTRDDYVVSGDAAGALDAYDTAVAAWRSALLSIADDRQFDTVGLSSYPHGSDPEEPFSSVAWWVNQELLHHGAEIALLRDLYRCRSHGTGGAV